MLFRFTALIALLTPLVVLPANRLPGLPPDLCGDTAAHPAPAPRLGQLAPPLGTTHYELLRRAAGDSLYRPFGRAVVARTAGAVGGQRMIQNVASYDWSNGTHTTDTTTALASTLAPVCERTHTPSRIVFYTFRGLRSLGRIGPEGATTAIDDTLPRPAFNSTDLDMIMTALPLGRHFEARLPLYDPEFPGFRIATVRVTGSTPARAAAGAASAWVVTVAQPNRAPLVYHIDSATHRVIEKDFGAPGGPLFRQLLTDGG